MAKGVKTGGGSRKGSPNRATAEARTAIALFVNRNAHRLQGWLDQIADGVREEPTDENPQGDWAVHPNPVKAFELFQSIIEYHVPKLGRTEHVDPAGNALPILRVEFIGKSQ